jgi:hypothetical protein
MKHIILTVLVCLDVAAFTAIYRRATGILTHAILEGLSEMSVSTDSSVPRDLTRSLLDTGVHNFTVR